MNALRKAWFWIRWPVALAIVALLVYQNREQLEAIAAAPKNWWSLAGAFVLVGGSTLLTFCRWYLLVWAQEFPFRLRDAMRLGFVGLLLNYIGPGSVGGDLFKAVLLAHEQRSRRAIAVATVFLDRVLGLIALFVVGALASLMPLALPETAGLDMATRLLWVGALAGTGGVALMLLPATTRWGWVNRLPAIPLVGRIAGELLLGVRLYQSKPRVILAAFTLSLAGHAGMIAGFYLCALWMSQPWVPDLLTHFYFMPNAELFGVLLPLPGGVGALEKAIEWFYTQLRPEGISLAQASAAGLLAAIAIRVVTVAIAAVGGGYYITARNELAEAFKEAQQMADTANAQ